MTPDPNHGDRVDTLREQLRALGYLDARVDRFVLGRVASGGRAWTMALGASVRIGTLAATLLGPATAAGLATRVPGLVTSLTDAIVLALYLAVLFGLGSAALALVAIMVAATIAKRATATPNFATRTRNAAGAAGLAVTAICLFYLTLWWQATGSVAPTAAVGLIAPLGSAWAQPLVLAIAVAISVLIGHTVTVTVLATVVRLGLAPSLPPGSPLSSWRALVPIGGTALIGALTLLAATAPGPTTDRDTPGLTVVPTGAHVVVIAIDGVDVATLTRLTTSGSAPTLAALTSGARATLVNDPDRDPARVWTTIATGQPPERHGIRALEARQLAGVDGRLRAESPGLAMMTAATDVLRLTRPAIASGDERRLPAFWEVAAAAGLRTAVVHWWATWPASDPDGVVVSDRAILRLEQGGALSGEIAPASLYDTWRTDADTRHARVTAAAAHAWPGNPSGDVVSTVRRSAELDATILDLAADPALGALDLRVVYLPGLDIAQHALLQGDGTPLAASATADRVRGIEAYYTFLDAALRRWLDALPPDNRHVILVTQPGRVQQPSAGWLAMSGPLSSTSVIAGADPSSVAPTVLTALGVPTALDSPGAALRTLFADVFQDRYPVRAVPTYGKRRAGRAPRTGQPLNQEMIERMRSLGYVR
ncbi:MAG: alkaline phosphatase family protein [Acidobacteria bacterium]|nr:alkaline phosphatase family protein [Acidobacteriota bacterium]